MPIECLFWIIFLCMNISWREKLLYAPWMWHLGFSNEPGEKYELAKRLGIKLANHRWLEDWYYTLAFLYNNLNYKAHMLNIVILLIFFLCSLKSWEILPVDDYNKRQVKVQLHTSFVVSMFWFNLLTIMLAREINSVYLFIQ